MRNVLILLTLAACTLTASAPVTVSGVVSLADYPTLQAAVNAVSNGGTVVIPAGVWDIGTVEVNAIHAWQKVVTIQGISPGYIGYNPPRGSDDWDYYITRGYVYGSVLRGNLTASVMGARLFLRDITLLGHGEGVGVDIGNGSLMFGDAGGLHHVAIGNYETGVRVRKGYLLPINDVVIAGVDVGVQIVDSNGIRLTGVDVTTCDTGAELQGVTIAFMDGSVQDCNAGVVMDTVTSTLGNIYFEDIPGLSLELSGDGNWIEPSFYASNAGGVLVSGHNNVVTLGLNPADPVEVTGNYNRVDGSAYLQCIDSGYGNLCVGSYP